MTNRREAHTDHAPSAASCSSTLGGGFLDDEAYEHVRQQAARMQRANERHDRAGGLDAYTVAA
jgi:hypothetical protein